MIAEGSGVSTSGRGSERAASPSGAALAGRRDVASPCFASPRVDMFLADTGGAVTRTPGVPCARSGVRATTGSFGGNGRVRETGGGTSAGRVTGTP
jgi:hypothetical protein